MKQITAYQTDDGKIHTNKAEAERYAEAKHADKLCTLATLLVKIEKYTEMCEFLADPVNLQQFIRLRALFEDIQVENNLEENS